MDNVLSLKATFPREEAALLLQPFHGKKQRDF